MDATTCCYSHRPKPLPKSSDSARRLADFSRGREVTVHLEGNPVVGHENESLAVALFASGVRVLSRSIKYHRPRGFFCLSGHCGACLIRVNGVPNTRACMTACSDGLQLERQNAWPSARVDLFATADYAFPKGFEPHTFMTRPATVNRVMQHFVRKLSGLGRLPEREAPLLVSQRTDIDVLIVGGGPAGLAAAAEAGRQGANTWLLDDQLQLGGRLLSDPRYGAASSAKAISRAREAGATLLEQTAVFGIYPEERLIGAISPNGALLIGAKSIVLATGGYEQNILFPGNDVPGVLPLRAAGRLLVQYGVLPGKRIVIVSEAPRPDTPAAQDTQDNDGGATVDHLIKALEQAGAEVSRAAQAPAAASGRAWVRSVKFADGRSIACDLVITVAPSSPASELARQAGAATRFDEHAGGFAVITDDRGRTNVPDVFACGDLCGATGVEHAAQSGAAAGRQAASAFSAVEATR